MSKLLDALKKVKEEEVINIKGYRPHPAQAKIHDIIINGNFKYHTLSCGRSFGKTALLEQQCWYWLANDPGCVVFYVTPTYKLAKKVFKDMLKILGYSKDNNIAVKSINKTDLTITMVNGSELSFHSSDNADALRGNNHINYLIVDEMAYCKEYLWSSVLSQCMIQNGKKGIFCSTPQQKNHFYDLFLKADKTHKSYDEDFFSLMAPSFENPRLPAKEVARMKKIKETNKVLYEMEYEAKFIEGDLNPIHNINEQIYFTPKLKENTPQTCPGKTIFGIDFGRKGDYTVVTVLQLMPDGKIKIVDIYRDRHKEWSEILFNIAELYKKWKPTFGYAETNFNDFLLENLKKMGCKNLAGFNTNMHSKPRICEEMILMFENKKMLIPNEEYLLEELRAFTFSYSAISGKIRYGAPAGGKGHDDCCMSLAFALAALKERSPNRKSLNYFRM